MPNGEASRKSSALTIRLDAALLASIEQQANKHMVSVSDFVRSAILDAMAKDEPKGARKPKITSERHGQAPLDAFLPEGTDPFAPTEAMPALATRFEDVQARMRFAGTPSILRDL